MGGRAGTHVRDVFNSEVLGGLDSYEGGDGAETIPERDQITIQKRRRSALSRKKEGNAKGERGRGGRT